MSLMFEWETGQLKWKPSKQEDFSKNHLIVSLFIFKTESEEFAFNLSNFLLLNFIEIIPIARFLIDIRLLDILFIT